MARAAQAADVMARGLGGGGGGGRMLTVRQWFKDRKVPFFPRSVVTDVLGSIGGAHTSGDFHRIVAADPARYFEPQSHLADMLRSLKSSGKKLLFVSNSPFWYVDAGIKYAIGEDWRDIWDAVIVSAGKPSFYTDDTSCGTPPTATSGRTWRSTTRGAA